MSQLSKLSAEAFAFQQLVEKLDNKKFLDAAKEADLSTLATLYRDVIDLHDIINSSKKAIYDIMNGLKVGVIPERMAEFECTLHKVKGVGKLGVVNDCSVSIPAKSKEETYDWLHENEHGELIVETVNAGSLRALYGQLLKKSKEILSAPDQSGYTKEEIEWAKSGNILPENLFKVNLFQRATLTREK